MGIWSKIKRKRAERKAEREAIKRSEDAERRAGDEPTPDGDPFEANRLAGTKW